MSKIDDYIIRKIKEKRIELNLSQMEFADMVNLSQSFIAHCENPKQIAKYNINHVNDICSILNIPIWDIIPQYPL
ncbi:hypothetical protein EZS27_026791 [termite gut metagenome]|uniref:HTH cro/C1-type domain-containing protein n=1 Tax=termite gut metagenome TaxID=433724 RepID=A0A5J4QRM6_9ZZZZ